MHAKRYLCTRYIFLLTHTTLRMKHTFLFALLLALFLPLPMQAIDFDPNMRYSREVIDACLYHFNANGTAAGFAQYDANGTKTEKSESSRGFDYVPGLVAKAVLEAIDYYKDSAFVKPWYYSMAAYGNEYAKYSHATSTTLDDLNACKLYFGLSDLSKPGAKFANATTYANCQTAKTSTLKGLENYNKTYSIPSDISKAFCGDDTYTGGWWHKKTYENEMWCDGQYMGPALLAQLLHDGKTFTGKTNTECWDIIARQFTMTWGKLWNNDKKLLYHAFSAVPANDSYWADQTQGAHYGVSAEFWARAEGWYFLALIDVLELMPASHPQYAVLRDYLNQIAQGLVARQDASTGCWCQLLQYANGVTPAGCSKPNYLESSGSALFVAGFLKGQRLGLFDTDYSAVAKKGYQGLVQQFLVLVKDQGSNKYALIQSCASAGLSEKNNRKGDANYYLSGKDTYLATPTEGKVLGAFILAAVEYERAYMVAQTTTRPAQNTVSRTYTADNTTNFSNPERGFYEQVEQVVTADGTSNLSDHYFSDGRSEGRSLLLRLYYLDNFRTKTLPQAVLDEITADMAKFRANGFKCILRFAYTAEAYDNASQNQDASPAIWQQHLSQLKQVLQDNADVIYVVQAGFLGAWGEWYYSSQGIGSAIPQDAKRNLISWLLDAVPANRCVQLRTPLFKTDYIGNTTALTDATAYKGTPQARLGHHNDAFCNGADNMGTYTNVATDKAYIAQECFYVPNGGETNIENDNDKTYTNYGTGAAAATEMKRLRYSYLNYSYSTYATDKWQAEKDASGSSYYDIMARQMGYRFVLTDGTYPTQATAGKNMHISLKINNTGYAPLYNERHAYIVLKNTDKTYRIQLQSDPRSWRPDQTTAIREDLSLPAEMVAGTYALYLHLPDADSRIAANPAYAVRLANTDIWDSATGYNSLNAQITIAPATPQQENTASCNCLNLTFL